MLTNWFFPTTVHELKSFFGFGNLYYNFIDELTALTSLFYDLTAGREITKKVQFTCENIERFAELKRRHCAAPRLAHPNLELPFTLYTDASKMDFGAVLL